MTLLIISNMSVFSGKTLLITGGSGSFGTAAVDRFIGTDIGEIRIFSRNPQAGKYKEGTPKLSFVAGDIRNADDCRRAMKGVDFVFHAAAMKDIPGCEKDPRAALLTNAVGTANVLDAAVDAGVEAVVCLSTDKAAYPVNVMGNTKALAERIAVTKALENSGTRICCTRFGNVLCSKGSVVPFWVKQIQEGKPVSVTEPAMTRFIMTLDEALDLVLYVFENGCSGDIIVEKSPACCIGTQAQAVCQIFGKDPSGVQVIGARPGEKMYETLLTKEEAVRAVDMGQFYRIPANGTHGSGIGEYNSDNAPRMTLEQIQAKLEKLLV